MIVIWHKSYEMCFSMYVTEWLHVISLHYISYIRFHIQSTHICQLNNILLADFICPMETVENISNLRKVTAIHNTEKQSAILVFKER